MAATKRGIDRRQVSLAVPALHQVESLKRFLASRDDESERDFDAFEEDAAPHADPDVKVSVAVSQVGDYFTIARLRDDGSTVACVWYTRAELTELRASLVKMEL